MQHHFDLQKHWKLPTCSCLGGRLNKPQPGPLEHQAAVKMNEGHQTLTWSDSQELLLSEKKRECKTMYKYATLCKIKGE